MNTAMASLAVQLAMYGVAWLLVGISYRLRRNVAIFWSAAWFAGAVSTLLVYLSGTHIAFNIDLAVNLGVMSCFLLIQQGVDAFTGHRARRWEFVVVLCAMLLVEWLRRLGEGWDLWRLLLFTLIVCWPLGTTAWRMAVWLRLQGQRPIATVALIISPLLATAALFVVRLLLVVQGTMLDAVQFNQGNTFDLVAAMLLLVMLGGFNFSLATLILGSVIERLRSLSETDQLTGLANRRVMMRRVDEEHARYRRSGHRYGVFMLDLDFFKRVNDSYGHHVGDQVLRAVAQVMAGCRRSTDTLARMGGEEFMLLAPLTEESGALVQASRICEALRNARLACDAGKLAVTLSVGVAIVQPGDATAHAVITRADAALYRAKAAGRDRVELAV